jgi:YggT family protein
MTARLSKPHGQRQGIALQHRSHYIWASIGINMSAVFFLVNTLFSLYWWIILLAVASTWLIHFGIVNAYNTNVRAILRFLHQATDPVLDPIRRIIPSIGGIDISPIIALIGLEFLRQLVLYTILPTLFGIG